MNPPALVFALLCSAALLAVPRQWAAGPLIAGACYMTLGQGIELGPFTFTVIRLLVAVGVVRVMVRGERLASRMNRLDWLMVAWSVCAIVSSAFHGDPTSAMVFRLGMVYNAAGIYFLLRVFCCSTDDVIRLCQMTALVISLLAVAMLYERVTLFNPFSVFGGVDEAPMIRAGRVRASGPFAHPILAGTVGAVALPLMVGLWRFHSGTAIVGGVSALAMIVASGSSGPILSALFSLFGLMMWFNRRRMRLFRWSAVAGLLALSLIMKAPVYYLIGRIDLVGGSTGWHRSRLMESAFEHVDEWWLAGTDYTRHWMEEGMGSDPTQVDITNHYLRIGVVGGLPLMGLFIWQLATAFGFVGRSVTDNSITRDNRHRFITWTLGCALFAHAATFISVSYFDQSFVMLYLTFAAIGSVASDASNVPDLSQSLRRPTSSARGVLSRRRLDQRNPQLQRKPAR